MGGFIGICFAVFAFVRAYAFAFGAAFAAILIGVVGALAVYLPSSRGRAEFVAATFAAGLIAGALAAWRLRASFPG